MRSERAVYKNKSGEGNYSAGMIGFSYRSTNVVSIGIAYFTREEAQSIPVSHSFYVVDANTIIEAEAEGVIMSDPKKYFNEPYIHVFFKKPIHLNPDYVKIMTDYALSLVGKPYDWGLFLNFLWQWIATKLHITISKKSPPLLDNPNWMMCSEVSASTLSQIPEYSNLDPLSEWHPARISPLKLFSSPIFEPWRFTNETTAP